MLCEEKCSRTSALQNRIRVHDTSFAPLNVSAPRRKPSAPSSTALATSVASARVGRGALVIVSHSRVTSTGMPTTLHAEITAL